MSTPHLVPDDIQRLYHVKDWRNGAGVLTTACPGEWQDLLAVLRGFRPLRSEVVVVGGNRSLISRRLDGAVHGGAKACHRIAGVVLARAVQNPSTV
jgi:hypothetical protein